MANFLLDALTDVARSQNPNAPAVKYGYASEIFPGLLGGSDTGLTDEELARNNQIWDRLGRGAPASPHQVGPTQPQAPKPQTASPSPAYPLDWQARAQGVTVPTQPQMNPPNPEVSTHRRMTPNMGPPMPLGLLAGDQNVPTTFGPKMNAPDTFSAPDIMKSITSGVGQRAAKTLGLPGSFHNEAKKLPWAPERSMYDGLMSKYGPLFGLNHLPDEAEMLQIAQNKFPQLGYQPQTRTGQVAQSLGRGAPGVLTRGAGAVMNGVKTVAGLYPWMLGATTSLGDERLK